MKLRGTEFDIVSWKHFFNLLLLLLFFSNDFNLFAILLRFLLFLILLQHFFHYFSAFDILWLIGWRILEDEGSKFMFIIDFAIERTWIALSMDFLIGNKNIKLRQPTFGTQNILIDKFVKSFEQILISEATLDNIGSISFSCFAWFGFWCLFCRLWCFFESKVF